MSKKNVKVQDKESEFSKEKMLSILKSIKDEEVLPPGFAGKGEKIVYEMQRPIATSIPQTSPYFRKLKFETLSFEVRALRSIMFAYIERLILKGSILQFAHNLWFSEEYMKADKQKRKTLLRYLYEISSKGEDIKGQLRVFYNLVNSYEMLPKLSELAMEMVMLLLKAKDKDMAQRTLQLTIQALSTVLNVPITLYGYLYSIKTNVDSQEGITVPIAINMIEMESNKSIIFYDDFIQLVLPKVEVSKSKKVKESSAFFQFITTIFGLLIILGLTYVGIYPKDTFKAILSFAEPSKIANEELVKIEKPEVIKQTVLPINTLDKLYNAIPQDKVAIENVKQFPYLDVNITLIGHSNSISALTQLSDGRLVSGSYDSLVKIWDMNTQECTMNLTGHKGWIKSIVQISNDTIATAAKDKTIKLWNITTGQCTHTLKDHGRAVTGLLKVNETVMASISYDGTLILWDLIKLKKIKKVEVHDDWVVDFALIPRGGFVTASSDKSFKLWDQNLAEEPYEYKKHRFTVNKVIVLDDGRIASGGADAKVFIVDPAGKKEDIEIKIGNEEIRAMFHYKQHYLALGLMNSQIKVFDLRSKELISTFTTHTGTVNCLVKLQGEEGFASASEDMTIKIYR